MSESRLAIALLVRQLDLASHDPFESIDSALDGVTEEQAFRIPVGYANEEREDGWPAPGTIAWQIAHVTHCKRHYTDCFRSMGKGAIPPVRPWTEVTSLAELRALLEEAHREQLAALGALTDDQLDAEVRDGTSLAEFATMTIRHDAWHASQIAVARRLLRTVGADAGA